jgi:predicted N-acetyltransferase YhbS
MTLPTQPTSPAVELHHLCRVPQVRAEVAALIHHEFWADVADASVETMAARLAQAGSPDALPLCLVAMEGAVPVGVVNLIDYDDPNPRVGTPWLAGMVVAPSWRGRGLGSRLVLALLDEAQRLRQSEVFLGTDGPSFYTRLGAQVHQQLQERFWLMRFDLAAVTPSIDGRVA